MTWLILLLAFFLGWVKFVWPVVLVILICLVALAFVKDETGGPR